MRYLTVTVIQKDTSEGGHIVSTQIRGYKEYFIFALFYLKFL